jgi:hypothetical protein
MAGFVLKSLHLHGGPRDADRSLFPEVQAFGGLALNNSVSGLNPIAIDMPAGSATRRLPSVDSANELQNVAGS